MRGISGWQNVGIGEATAVHQGSRDALRFSGQAGRTVRYSRYESEMGTECDGKQNGRRQPCRSDVFDQLAPLSVANNLLAEHRERDFRPQILDVDDGDCSTVDDSSRTLRAIPRTDGSGSAATTGGQIPEDQTGIVSFHCPRPNIAAAGSELVHGPGRASRAEGQHKGADVMAGPHLGSPAAVRPRCPRAQ